MGSGVEAGVAVRRAAKPPGVAAPSSVRLVSLAGPPAVASGGSCPELDCVRALLPGAVLAAAERRAAKVGVGADRALIAAGHLSEEAYLHALADSLGIAFDPLAGSSRLLCPLNDDRLIEAPADGLLPLLEQNGLTLVVAPRGRSARQIIGMLGDRPDLAQRFRFTTAARLSRFVLRNAAAAITARAAERLKQTCPDLSAGNAGRRWSLAPLAVLAVAALAGPIAAPSAVWHVFALILSSLFLGWLGLRVAGALAAPPAPPPQSDLPDDALPVYSIIAALYREAASVGGLLSAIERLDYPAEKLDVILAVEADDNETRAAIAARNTRLPISVVPVPVGGPRTKPKALNVALLFARGTFTVIYDAEDNPEPGQLRRTLQAFRCGDNSLACLQASLCIDNTADSWLTRMSTAEYAGQFDVFLPGLAALRLPLPLGGSSNHFRTATLREVGGWDAYNVTEDADLGMRLARFGYRCGTIDSTTYEEAPVRIDAWLRQRTRWFKGWMQTWFTHMRAPGQLLRDLGPLGFISFQLIVGGNTLAALVHPLFLIGLVAASLSGAPPWSGDNLSVAFLVALYGTTAVSGYVISIVLGWLGLWRRGLLSTAWVLILTPLHWLLLSLAVWRALYQLFAAPYKWEKTEHGLAKNSRRNSAMTGTLIELECYLRRLKQTGEPPSVTERTTDTCADPSPRPAASASG